VEEENKGVVDFYKERLCLTVDSKNMRGVMAWGNYSQWKVAGSVGLRSRRAKELDREYKDGVLKTVKQL
jgi:hypothetical protein